MRLVNSIWDRKVDGLLTDQQANKAGIKVGIDHVNDFFSKILSQNSLFTDESGAFQLAKVQEYVKDAKDNNPGRYRAWLEFEKSVEQQATQDIYYDMIKAASNVSVKEAMLSHKLENETVDIKYVQLPYSTIEDSTIDISDAEINTYIKAHKNDFKHDAYTSIEYVKIDEVATDEDEKEIQNQLKDLIKDKEEFNTISKTTETVLGFENTENYVDFIAENSDKPYNDKYTYKVKASEEVRENLFTAEIGTVYGPYEEYGKYKLSKLLDIKKGPYSLNLKQIVIAWNSVNTRANRTQEEAKVLADSLFTVVTKDVSKFGVLAKEFSNHFASANKEGDLGTVRYDGLDTQTANTVFFMKGNAPKLIETDKGYKIVKVSDRDDMMTLAKIATIEKEIVPSEKTINEVYASAVDFQSKAKGKDFKEVAKSLNLEAVSLKKVEKLDESFPNLTKQRPLVKWSFDEDTAIGDIKSFDVDEGYIIAKLTTRKEAGISSSEDASSRVIPLLKKEKKAAKLIESLKGDDLAKIATNNGVSVKTATGINMKNATISGIGREKTVIGTAFGLKENQVSKPIIGEKGVYIVQVTTKNKAPELATYSAIAKQESSKLEAEAKDRLLAALEANAEILDKRASFY